MTFRYFLCFFIFSNSMIQWNSVYEVIGWGRASSGLFPSSARVRYYRHPCVFYFLVTIFSTTWGHVHFRSAAIIYTDSESKYKNSSYSEKEISSLLCCLLSFLKVLIYETVATILPAMFNCPQEVCSNYISPVGLFICDFSLDRLLSLNFEFIWIFVLKNKINRLCPAGIKCS